MLNYRVSAEYATWTKESHAKALNCCALCGCEIHSSQSKVKNTLNAETEMLHLDCAQHDELLRKQIKAGIVI